MDRRIFITLLLAIFIALLGMGIIVPIMPIYATELGASGTTLGLMVAGFAISRGILQPFVGALSDRQGRKRFLVTGLLIYSITGSTYVFASSVEHLILIRIIHGVGSAMITPIAMAYFADLAPQGQEGRYMGYLNIALFGGIGAGPVIGGLFRDNVGIDAGFYSMTALSALAMVFVLVFLPSDSADANRPVRAPLSTTFKLMLHNPKVMGILLSRIGTMLVMIPSMAFLPILMTDVFGATGLQIGIVMTVRVLTSAALQTVVGPFVDRHNKIGVLVAGSLTMAAGVALVPFADSFSQFIIIFAFVGIADSLIWPTLGALAAEEGRLYGQGAMMGVFNMAMSVGILIGALGAGTLVDSVGMTYAFVTVAAVLVPVTFIASNMISRGSGEAKELAVPAEPLPARR